MKRKIECLDCKVGVEFDHVSGRHIEYNEDFYFGLEEFILEHNGHRIKVQKSGF